MQTLYNNVNKNHLEISQDVNRRYRRIKKLNYKSYNIKILKILAFQKQIEKKFPPLIYRKILEKTMVAIGELHQLFLETFAHGITDTFAAELLFLFQNSPTLDVLVSAVIIWINSFNEEFFKYALCAIIDPFAVKLGKIVRLGCLSDKDVMKILHVATLFLALNVLTVKIVEDDYRNI